MPTDSLDPKAMRAEFARAARDPQTARTLLRSPDLVIPREIALSSDRILFSDRSHVEKLRNKFIALALLSSFSWDIATGESTLLGTALACAVFLFGIVLPLVATILKSFDGLALNPRGVGAFFSSMAARFLVEAAGGVVVAFIGAVAIVPSVVAICLHFLGRTDAAAAVMSDIESAVMRHSAWFRKVSTRLLFVQRAACLDAARIKETYRLLLCVPLGAFLSQSTDKDDLKTAKRLERMNEHGILHIVSPEFDPVLSKLLSNRPDLALWSPAPGLPPFVSVVRNMEDISSTVGIPSAAKSIRLSMEAFIEGSNLDASIPKASEAPGTDKTAMAPSV